MAFETNNWNWGVIILKIPFFNCPNIKRPSFSSIKFTIGWFLLSSVFFLRSGNCYQKRICSVHVQSAPPVWQPERCNWCSSNIQCQCSEFPYTLSNNTSFYRNFYLTGSNHLLASFTTKISFLFSGFCKSQKKSNDTNRNIVYFVSTRICQLKTTKNVVSNGQNFGFSNTW